MEAISYLCKAVRRYVKGSFFCLIMGAGFLGVACQGGSFQEKDSGNGDRGEEASITAQVADSMEKSLSSHGEGSTLRRYAPKVDSLRKKAQSLPPPKKEAWMDTLTDLTGITPPNAATLLSEDPAPLNKNSVEILISSQFHNRHPEELILRVYVSEMGTVLRYQLLKASNPRLGAEYFVRPLLELRFSPAKQGQKAVPAWTTIHLQIPSAL